MTDKIKSDRPDGDGLRMPVLVPDRNSASGYSIQYLSIEVDADLARALDGCATPPKPTPDAMREPVSRIALKNLLAAIQSRAINKLPIPYWEGTIAMETLSKAEGEAMTVLEKARPGTVLQPIGFRWKESLDQINWRYTDSINTYIPAEAIIEPLYLGPPADGAKP